MSFIADRGGVKPSATMQILDRVKALKRAGEDVTSLSVGEPDFATPEHIREYAKQALDEGYTYYPDAAGLWELREAIAGKLERDNNIDADPASEIVVTVGAKEAIFAVMMATINPGDEVIVPDPCWVSYVPCIQLCGGTPVYLPLSEEDGFRISMDRLEEAVSAKTKILILNSPNNPIGNMMGKSDLEAVAELAKRKRFLVLSDEIYEKIVFDGETHLSIASFPGMKEFSVTVNGFSKSMAMTGWRLGYLVAPSSIAKCVTAIHGHLVTGACSFAQRAAALALRDERTDKTVRDMVEEYQVRRDMVVGELAKVDGISCFSPRGTFYAFPNIASIGLKSQELAMKLLDRSKVAVVPGDAFGKCGEGFIRLSFATSRDRLKIALERIRDAVSELR
jgi:aspartate/methionine/tyrosine aminotransferase